MITELDFWISELIQANFNPLVNGIFNVITRMGDWYTVTVLFFVLAYILKKRAGLQALIYPIVSVCGFWIIFDIIKHIVRRPRPLGLHLVDAAGYSFPSMHAGMSLIFYGWFAYLLFRHRIIDKYCAILIGAVMTVLIGTSRIFMNVHYLSDIMAGWILGGVFLYLSVRFFAENQRRRGRL